MLDNIAQTTDKTQQEPNWRALVEEARRLHVPSVLSAGEYDDGTCAICETHPTRALLNRYRDHLNGSRSKVWMHDHVDEYPCCNTCAAGYDGRADWPCATAIALDMAAG